MVIVLNSRFPLGSLVATPNALAALTDWDLQVALQRHAAGDWGDLCNQDKEANSTALLLGGRLLSAFHAQNGTSYQSPSVARFGTGWLVLRMRRDFR